MNSTAVEIATDVTLTGKHGKVVAQSGTVLEFDLAPEPNMIHVYLGRFSATISMEDAIPVVWDGDEYYWA